MEDHMYHLVLMYLIKLIYIYIQDEGNLLPNEPKSSNIADNKAEPKIEEKLNEENEELPGTPHNDKKENDKKPLRQRRRVE